MTDELIKRDDFDLKSVAKHRLPPDTDQWVLRFNNGWGASIIHGHGSYGIEAAVLDSAGKLNYEAVPSPYGPRSTHGWLDRDGLYALLRQIEALPPKQAAVSGSRQAVEGRP